MPCRLESEMGGCSGRQDGDFYDIKTQSPSDPAISLCGFYPKIIESKDRFTHPGYGRDPHHSDGEDPEIPTRGWRSRTQYR